MPPAAPKLAWHDLGARAVREVPGRARQIPFNEHHPGHILTAEPPYCDELEGFIQRFVALQPAEYAVLLDRLGFVDPLVRLQVYPHRLPEGAGVADFLQGSLLTGYKRLLSPAHYREFFAEYRRRVGAGPYLYAFERLQLRGRLP